MFVTEWGSAAPLLERARLDGTKRTKLVEQKIVYPFGVAVDLPREEVYWVDTYLDVVERIRYDGSRRTTVYRGTPVSTSPSLRFWGNVGLSLPYIVGKVFLGGLWVSLQCRESVIFQSAALRHPFAA